MDKERSRSLAAAGYLVASTMVVVTGYDLVMRLMPARGDITWRIGAVGMVSLEMGTLLLAYLLLCGTALLLEHRRVLRTLSVIGIVCAAVSVLVLPFFALDVLQLRNAVRPDARTTVDLTMARAALAILLTSAALVWMGIGSWKAAGPIGRRAPRKAASSLDTRLPVGAGR